MAHYHAVRREHASMDDVYSVYTEVIKKRNAVSPAQKEEPARKYDYHRHYIHHEVDEHITGGVALNGDNHFPRVAGELQHPINMNAHYEHRYPLAEPAEELQNSSVVSVATFGCDLQHITYINTFQQSFKLFLLFLRHIF